MGLLSNLFSMGMTVSIWKWWLRELKGEASVWRRWEAVDCSGGGGVVIQVALELP